MRKLYLSKPVTGVSTLDILPAKKNMRTKMKAKTRYGWIRKDHGFQGRCFRFQELQKVLVT